MSAHVDPIRLKHLLNSLSQRQCSTEIAFIFCRPYFSLPFSIWSQWSWFRQHLSSSTRAPRSCSCSAPPGPHHFVPKTQDQSTWISSYLIKNSSHEWSKKMMRLPSWNAMTNGMRFQKVIANPNLTWKLNWLIFFRWTIRVTEFQFFINKIILKLCSDKTIGKCNRNQK